MPDAFAQLEDQDYDSRVVLDYTSRDFTAIRSQLVGLAKGLMPEWETAGEPSDFGTLLMEIFAYMGDVMHFYIDRSASEAFLGSAIRQQSVLYIANMLGYTPIGQQAATVTLNWVIDPNAIPDITVPDSEIETIVIPKGTRVHNNVGNADEMVVFETDLEVTLPWTDSSSGTNVRRYDAVGYATEGVMRNDRLLGICRGAPSTEFMITDKGVVHGTISVTTREGFQVVEWNHIDNLSLARPTQPVFTSYRDDQGFTHLVFGDNAAGRIPPVNAEVFVNYRYGVGAAANSVAPHTITTIINPDTTNDWTLLSVDNPFSPVGGTDPESVDAMRQSIPRAAARIKNRAITLHDYADMALQVPGVAKSVSYGTVYTAVRVKIAPNGGSGTDESISKLCNDVEVYMADKIIIGSHVYAEPETMAELWQDVFIRLLVHVQKGYSRTTVRKTVDATIRQILAFDSVDFGTRVSIGQVYRAALAIQGVEWCELTWLNIDAPVDNTDPGAGDTADVIRVTWRHNTSTTIGDPGAGKYIRNSATNPTALALAATDSEGVPVSVGNLQVGDHLVYSPVGDPHSWMSLLVTSVPTNVGHTTYYTLNVSKLDEAVGISPPNNNQLVLFSALRYKPTPDSLGGVIDIDTDEFLIPRIAPMPTLKTAIVTNRVMTGGKATLTTAAVHNMIVGETIEVKNVNNNEFNGQFKITAVPTAITLVYDKVGEIATATSSGTITTVNLPESPTDYPGMTDEERTHDGLWVIADGGLQGT